MDLLPSPEEEQIVDSVKSFLTKELSVDYLRWEKGALTAPDRNLLPQIAELGWIALGLSENDGGFGYGATEEMLLFREVGRSLLTPMMLAAVMAARLTALVAKSEMTEAIIADKIRVGFAVPAAKSGAVFLIDAVGVDQILIVEDKRMLLVAAAGITGRETVRSVDSTVTLERAILGDEADALIVSDDAAQGLFCHLSLLISSMLVGMSEAVRDLTVEHVTEREQFGHKIGSFQAVSHPCADMAVRCEAALSQTKVAAVTTRDKRSDAEFQVLAARIVSMEAALSNASKAIQLHGGMGFAAECPIHFFLKRAHLLDQIGGKSARHLDVLFEQSIVQD